MSDVPDMQMGAAPSMGDPEGMPENYVDPNTEIPLNLSVEMSPVLEGGGGPVPENIYPMQLVQVEAQATKAKELQLILWSVIEDGEYVGRKIRDTALIPGADRKANDFKKYQLIMGMTRQKLEAITGKEWRSENMTLRPKELEGNTFQAAVIQAPYSYVKDGVTKNGIGNEIQRYFATGEQAVLIPSPPQMQAAPNGAQPAQQFQQPTATPGSFRL